MSNPQSFELGTALKITTVLSVAPTSVAITIKNPSNIIMVNAAAMSADTSIVYTYIYQSATTDNDGEYKVIIDATIVSGVNTYTSRVIQTFVMTDKDE